MKKNIIFVTFFAGLIYIVCSSDSGGAGRVGNTDATGASGNMTSANAGCSCHNNQTSLIAVSLELDSSGVAVSQYRPGGSYTIKISGANNTTNSLPYFGFQLACVQANANNAGGASSAGSPSCVNAGTFGTLPTSVQRTTSSYFPEAVIEHSAPIAATSGTGGAGTTYIESIPWTAPAAGTGPVVFYGALNAVNHDGTNGGDYFNIANTLLVTPYGTSNTCE